MDGNFTQTEDYSKKKKQSTLNACNYYIQFQDNLVQIIQHDSEASIRMHAIMALHVLYLDDYYTDESNLVYLYELMCLAATKDPSPEVREIAFNFFHAVIEREFKKQNVLTEIKKSEYDISGTFKNFATPEEHAIEHAYTIALLELSRLGVFHAFAYLIETEFSVHVLRTILVMIRQYFGLLKKHAPRLFKVPKCVLEGANTSFSEEFHESVSQNVLQFLDLIKSDELEKRYNAKTAWSESMDGFGSLLDDMLIDDGDNNVNDLDCY